MNDIKTLNAGNLNIVLKKLESLLAMANDVSCIESVVIKLDHGLRVSCNVDKDTVAMLEELLLKTTTKLKMVTDKALLDKYLICKHWLFVNTDWDEDPQVDGYTDGEIHASFAKSNDVYVIPRSVICSDERIKHAEMKWKGDVLGLTGEIGSLICYNKRLFQRTQSGGAYIYRDIDNGEIWIG